MSFVFCSSDRFVRMIGANRSWDFGFEVVVASHFECDSDIIAFVIFLADVVDDISCILLEVAALSNCSDMELVVC